MTSHSIWVDEIKGGNDIYKKINKKKKYILKK